MEIDEIQTPQLNQNGYHRNIFTKERIGTLFIYPINYTPDDCLSCDGYSLSINDYKELYKIIGTKFKKSGDATGTFRIPDYNVTGRFLQPNAIAGTQINAGLPNITGWFGQDGINATSNAGIVWGASGAFYLDSSTTSVATYNCSGTSRNVKHVAISAKKSSSIYGNSSTVQPPAQTVHVCIKYK